MGRDETPMAAGVPAIVSTLRHAHRQTGLLRGLRVLASANQSAGFDCPGCAWPDPAQRSPFEFCENGAKAILDEATTRRVTTDFFRKHSVAELRERPERWLSEQGRLQYPMVRRGDQSRFEPIELDLALRLVARELSGLDSPDRAAFYTSGRASNEAAFIFQLLARRLGTNNLPDCSNLCHESSGVALKDSLGIGKATVRLTDFREADLILVIGQNPGSNHPRMLSTLREAREAGAVIVSINPLIEPGFVRFAHPQSPTDLLEGGVALASHFVRVSVGGDQALFRGLAKALLEEPPSRGSRTGIDADFLRDKTAGFPEYRAGVQATSWAEIERLSGVHPDEIRALAQLAREATGIICTWAMGITQHAHAVATISEVVDFLLLGGHVGRPGSGLCPVRGHSNVQGDRTVGIATTIDPDHALRLEREFTFQVPRASGRDSVATIEGLLDGTVSHFVSLGGNFLSACPDTDRVSEGLQRSRLNVQIATKLNRSHLFGGGTTVLLPCLGRTDEDRIDGRRQVVSVEDSMGVVHGSAGRNAPPSEECWGEPRLLARLGELVEEELVTREARAGRMGGESAIEWKGMQRSYEVIRSAIERVVPGFARYEARLARPEGFELPNGPRDGEFTTPSRKAHFLFGPLVRLLPEEGELILTSVRSHDQFNTTVYTDDDRYRGVFGNRRVLLLNVADLEKHALRSGDRIWIESRWATGTTRKQTRRISGFVALHYDVPPGTAVGYFPEVNPLYFLESRADRSRTPTSKAVRIVIGRDVTAAEPGAE